MPKKLLAPLLFLWLLPAAAADDARLLLQLVDYVGVDYPEAVADGAVINAAEYAEMRDFAGQINAGLAALPDTPASAELQELALQLDALIQTKAPPHAVATLTRDIRNLLLRHYDLVLTPARMPDLARGKLLYAQHCAACHGANGRANGPLAGSLEPPPTDFHDAARARARSLFGLYNTITLGVDGTGMASFAQLSDADRWALAFYVGGFYPDPATLQTGQDAWQAGKLGLKAATTLTPEELEAQLDADGAALAAWVRRHPAALFSERPDPISTAIALIDASVEQYAAGNPAAARSLAVSAYLDGFELAEAALSNVAADQVLAIETAMLEYRAAVQSGMPAEELRREAAAVTGLLRQAREALNSGALTPGVAFTSSLVILLREGLEAILILGAIAAFMIKTQRRDALKYLHYGWMGALAAGVATWAVSAYVINISGAMREVTEGVTALLAAGILFYVGFWMHNKLNARRWTKFLQDKIQSALDTQALWTLAAVSFVAVYREVFETVLFYQALWAQADAGAHDAVFGGATAAAALLVAATWGIFKFGLRLPLRQFFAISGSIMFILAVVFAGKGVVALQEAGKLPISPVAFPRIDVLGIYPNLQGLLLQLGLILIAAALMLYNRRSTQTA